jgi:hypothetical protein
VSGLDLPSEERVVGRGPAARVVGDAEFACARGDADVRARRQGASDSRAAPSLGVAVPHDGVLGRGPAPAPGRPVHAQGLGAEAHRIGGAAEVQSKRADVAAVRETAADRVVLLRVIAPPTRPMADEGPLAPPDGIRRPAEARGGPRSGNSARRRRPQQRVLACRP